MVLLTCWRSPRELRHLESQEKVEERFLQFDSLEKHSPEYFATQVEQCLMELKPEEPDSWPHKLVLAQWIALADKWGFAQAMDDDFPSLFVKDTSAWQAAYKTMLEAKAFREQWWDLLGYVHQEQAARILAYHPWRPKEPPAMFFAHTKCPGQFRPCLEGQLVRNGRGQVVGLSTAIGFIKQTVVREGAEEEPTMDE